MPGIKAVTVAAVAPALLTLAGMALREKFDMMVIESMDVLCASVLPATEGMLHDKIIC